MLCRIIKEITSLNDRTFEWRIIVPDGDSSFYISLDDGYIHVGPYPTSLHGIYASMECEVPVAIIKLARSIYRIQKELVGHKPTVREIFDLCEKMKA